MTLEQNETLPPPPQPEYKTVCGGKIKDSTKYPSAVYRGEEIYFCTQACLEVFIRPRSVHGGRDRTSS